MYRKFIYLIMLLIFPVAVVNAEEDMMATADKFAACKGKYSALANYSMQHNMPKEITDNFSGNANGAKLAAAVLIQISRKETKALSEYEPYIDSVAHPHEAQLKVTLLDPSISLETVLMQEMKDCVELNPLQAKIANEMRKEIYLNK